MDAQAHRGSMRFFSKIQDPRCTQGRRHRLSDMIVIAICAIICNADGWEDIELFGLCKERWFRTFLSLRHGIPSHDTFARVFARLAPAAFEACFMEWMAHLAKTSKGRLIAVDGKTLRRSFNTAANKAALHMINAWCVSNQTVLGQLACGVKENEITALPKLLQLLDLRGAVVAADAMHCQKATAQRILDCGGDYLLQVKANQPALYENLKLFFEEGLTDDCQGVAYDFVEETDAGHGRIETRRCWSSWDIAGPVNGPRFAALFASSAPARSATRPVLHATITSRACPAVMPDTCCDCHGVTGVSRTSCTGAWTWCSWKINAASAKKTPMRITHACHESH